MRKNKPNRFTSPARSFAGRFSIAFLLLALGFAAVAEESGERVKREFDICERHDAGDPVLCSYEPTTIGYTKDSDDVGFMDIKLSVKYQIFPDWTTRGFNRIRDGLGQDSALYFAFTGRLGQYVGERESSPVVGKRFNPKLFIRKWTDAAHESYVDFAFLAHESNGQSINNPEQYQQARLSAQNPEFAKDQISRGWDYLEIIWKNSFECEHQPAWCASTSVTLKHFLANGLLQGRPEEYNSWENDPEGKTRSRVNGVGLLAKFSRDEEWWILKDAKLAAGFETGYRDAFQFNTFRIEVGTKLKQLPVILWARTGYGSDLAQYYKKVNSWGINIEFGSF